MDAKQRTVHSEKLVELKVVEVPQEIVQSVEQAAVKQDIKSVTDLVLEQLGMGPLKRGGKTYVQQKIDNDLAAMAAKTAARKAKIAASKALRAKAEVAPVEVLSLADELGQLESNPYGY